MEKEHRFVFDNIIAVVEEPYKNDKGCVIVGKKCYDEVEILFKSYNELLIKLFLELEKHIISAETRCSKFEKNWEVLKEYVEKNHNVADEDYAIIYSFVLNKMQELEEN